MIRPAVLLGILVSSLAGGQSNDMWPLDRAADARPHAESASISQRSAMPIDDESAKKQVHPRLIFHCTPGPDSAMNAKIDWQRFISSFNTDVSFKVDAQKKLWLRFGVDDSNTVTQARSGEDSAALIDYLRAGGTLTVGVTPYAAAAVSVRYDLAGFEGAINSLRAHCGIRQES